MKIYRMIIRATKKKKNKEQEKQILVLQDQASKIKEKNVKADENVDAIEQ